MVSPLFIDNEIFSKEYCFELLQEKETFLNSIILDELLVAHAKYLPQFADKIAELKAAGVASKDPVVMDLMVNGH